MISKKLVRKLFFINASSRLDKLDVELLRDNKDPAKSEGRSDMNRLMARVIFCFFAEDTDIFRVTKFCATFALLFLTSAGTANADNVAQLQGDWTSVNDQKASLTVAGQKWIGKYENKIQESNNFAVANNCLNHGGKIDASGKFVVFPDDEEMCLAIVKLSKTELNLSLVGLGNTLSYVRAGTAKQKISAKPESIATTTGLIPSDFNTCKPIPEKWKPGTKVYNKDFAKHHPRYSEGGNIKGMAHAVMRQHCIWVQKIDGFDWRVVVGRNAVFEKPKIGSEGDPNQDPDYRLFSHEKQGPLDIKEAAFTQSLELKSKPIYNFVHHNNGRWHGTIEYLKSLGNEQYLVLVSYWKGDRPGLIKVQCQIQENGDTFYFTECGRPIMRPQHDYAAINNIKRLKPQKKMPDGSFGSLKRGTFSVLKNAESFPIWKTTLGPIAVLRDNPGNNNAKSHFAAKFSAHANGVIRMWTKDGKKYTGHWARKCRGYTAFDQWWSKTNNTDNTRDYQTCRSSKKARTYKKNGWSAQYQTLDGQPSSCWGSIVAFKKPLNGTFNGYIKECGVGQAYEFTASMGSLDPELERKRRELAEIQARRAKEEERLRRAAEIEAEKRRLAEAEEIERLRAAEAEARKKAEAEKRLRARIAILQNGTVGDTSGGEVWQSTWGPVVVAVDADGRFTARYNDRAMGWVSLSSSDGIFYKGYWARNCGQEEPGCGSTKTTRNGVKTQCWGNLWGEVNDTNNKFKGSWDYCGSGATDDWNGWK